MVWTALYIKAGIPAGASVSGVVGPWAAPYPPPIFGIKYTSLSGRSGEP
jgi:hypothetical protein